MEAGKDTVLRFALCVLRFAFRFVYTFAFHFALVFCVLHFALRFAFFFVLVIKIMSLKKIVYE